MPPMFRTMVMRSMKAMTVMVMTILVAEAALAWATSGSVFAASLIPTLRERKRQSIR